MEIRSETRSVDPVGVSSVTIEPEGTPLYSIRWSAVIAGFAVGLGVHVLFVLIGIAAGLAVVGAGERPEGGSISIAAATWNTVSMLIAAFIGGYVASRSSGLRRTSDGMLHGVVSWGATMLFFAILTGSVTGNALGGMFGMAANTATTAAASAAAVPGESGVGELLSSLERGDRAATVNVLQNRFGMSPDQASRAAEQALALTGRSPSGADAQAGGGERIDVAQTASAASAWLSAAILLSLLAGAGGGLLGARGARRPIVPERHERHVSATRRRHVPTAG
ncbi:hypothetical protein [Aromatoleum aromaticum]|nr:hypothetical protein [Aromatoleum aromaticum]NMG54484.1 hypothetical protein [Aromatoleum aromaticum]